MESILTSTTLRIGAPAPRKRNLCFDGERVFVVSQPKRHRGPCGYAAPFDNGFQNTAEEAVPIKAVPVSFAPESDVQHAFQNIARACLHQLVANQSLMLTGDEEALHQMRVALWRLRAAISLFSDMLTDPQTEALKSEFKWTTSELGPAREFEVLLKHVASPVADRPFRFVLQYGLADVIARSVAHGSCSAR